MPTGQDDQRAEAGEAREVTVASRPLGMTPYWWAVFLLVWPAVGVSLLTRSLMQSEKAESEHTLAERVVRLEALRKADHEALDHYRWIDRDKGIVGLPIDRAMELEEGRLKNKEVGPSPVLLPGALLRQPPASAPKP